jgi:hypothetical protein
MLIPAMRAMVFLQCPVNVISRSADSTLALLVARVGADHAHNTVAADDFAVAAHFLDRCSDFHVVLLNLCSISNLRSLRAKHDTSPTQIVGRQLDSDLVAREDADVVHSHLSGNMTKDHVTVLQLHSKRSVGQVLDNLALHLDDIILGHLRMP